jgi:hypothetical protein
MLRVVVAPSPEEEGASAIVGGGQWAQRWTFWSCECRYVQRSDGKGRCGKRSYESYILELVWGRYALSELWLYEAAIAPVEG